jgi:integrase
MKTTLPIVGDRASGTTAAVERLTVRPRLGYPITAFPPMFVDELGRYLVWLGSPDDPAVLGRKPGTVSARREALRLAASELADLRGGPSGITSLALLVQPDNARLILEARLQRTHDGEPNGAVRSLAINLLALGRQWVKPSDADLDRLIELRHKIGSARNGLTAASREILRRMDDPAARQALLALPETLAKNARRSRPRSRTRAYRLRTALAIELLLNTGMRPGPLAAVRLADLEYPASQVLRITLRARHTPDGAPQQYELGEAALQLLREYLDAARRASAATPDDLLFVGLRGQRVAASWLAPAVRDATREALGIAIPPREFRHICAKLFLEHHPHDFGGLKDLLGHRFIDTTFDFYGALPRSAAAARWNDRLHDAARTSQLDIPVANDDRHGRAA